MALHRKFDALMRLRPDIAVIGECANGEVLHKRGLSGFDDQTCLWMGKNVNKGLGVFAFNGFRLSRFEPFYSTLRYVLPVHVWGPSRFNLLAVWALNLSGGISKKRQSGPLRRAIGKYREFLTAMPAVIGGDLNNNAIWDKPGWRINHMTKVDLLKKINLESAYHAIHGERHGEESVPTIYWRDRRKDGPTYHLDYAFVPTSWLPLIREFEVGTFEDWCGSGLSDHVPLMLDIDV